MNRAFVVDASIATKWVIDEDDTELAFTLARGELLAPDLLLLECANAIWVRVRRREINLPNAVDRLELLREMPVAYHRVEELVDDALALAVDLGHPIYDCVYLALALRHDFRVVTADRRFARSVRDRKALADRVVTLKKAVTH